MKSPRTWLLTAAFVVAPLVGVGMVLYGIGRVAVRRRPKEGGEAYAARRAERPSARTRIGHEGAPGPAADPRIRP